MILLLRRKGLSFPAGICRRFSVTRVYRPGRREQDFLKHCSIEPVIATSQPEFGVTDIARADPGPRIIAPETPFLISAGKDELHEIMICYVKRIDRKGRDEHRVRFKFVVPAECILTFGMLAERRMARGNIHRIRF